MYQVCTLWGECTNCVDKGIEYTKCVDLGVGCSKCVD